MKKITFVIFAVLLWSCDDIIEVEDISGRSITILAPTSEAVLTNPSVNFTWNDVEDANQYKLQVATPNFQEALQIVLDSTVTTTNFLKTLELGEYEWRVRAENSDYQTVYSTQSFTVEE